MIWDREYRGQRLEADTIATWPGTFGDVGPEGEVSALLVISPEGGVGLRLPRPRGPRHPDPLRKFAPHVWDR